MASVKPYQDISLQEWKATIRAFGSKRVVMAEGETGIGKTEVWRSFANELQATHVPIYVCVPHLALGDTLFPLRVEDAQGNPAIDFVPNLMFALDQGKPLNILWDEVGKSTDPGILKQLRACFIDKHLGRFPFPEGTIQSAATNFAAEGFGDFLDAYESNTLAWVRLRKPNDEEWTQNWALDAGIHPAILQAVRTFPQMMQSWREFKDPADNPYINWPGEPRGAFVSPRSLHTLSEWLFASEAPEAGLDIAVRTHVAGGIVGEPAAREIMSSYVLFGQLPEWKEVIKNPSKAKLPSNAAAGCLFIYSALQKLDEQNITPLMTFLKRMSPESQALFATTALRTGKAGIATSNDEFFKWAEDNHWMFTNNTSPQQKEASA